MNWNCFYNKYRDLYEYAKKYAYQYHLANYKIFVNDAIFPEDLAQELKLFLKEFIKDIRTSKFINSKRNPKIASHNTRKKEILIKDYKKAIIPKKLRGKELKKIVGNALYYKLRQLKEKSIIHNKIFINILTESDNYMFPWGLEQKVLDYLNLQHQEGEEVRIFKFDDIKKMLKDIDFQILLKRFKEDKTFEEIGKDIGYTGEFIRQRYNKSIQYLRKKILKNPKIIVAK